MQPAQSDLPHIWRTINYGEKKRHLTPQNNGKYMYFEFTDEAMSIFLSLIGDPKDFTIITVNHRIQGTSMIILKICLASLIIIVSNQINRRSY